MANVEDLILGIQANTALPKGPRALLLLLNSDQCVTTEDRVAVLVALCAHLSAIIEDQDKKIKALKLDVVNCAFPQGFGR